MARSSANTRGWVTRGAVGFERVSDAAPLALWPGAGEGQVRAPLLRAHPLLSDGVVDLTASSAFGRTLASAARKRSAGWSGRRSCGSASLDSADVARASRQAADGRSRAAGRRRRRPAHQDSGHARSAARRRRARPPRRRERADVRLAVLRCRDVVQDLQACRFPLSDRERAGHSVSCNDGSRATGRGSWPP